MKQRPRILATTSCLLAWVLLCLSLGARAQAPFQIVDLGTLGGDRSIAHDVNELGQVVGEARRANGTSAPFLWLPAPAYGLAPGMHDLGASDGVEGRALGLNDLGQVVGSIKDENGMFRAFLWLPAPAYELPAGLHDLGTLGGPEAEARAISNSGVVVGMAVAFPSPFASGHAFRWDEGGMSDLGTLANLDVRRANDVNAEGRIAGTVGSDWVGSDRAFVWLVEAAGSLPAGMSDLGTLGIAGAFAEGIDDSGAVVGTAAVSGSSTHAFLWLPEAAHGLPAGMNDLGTLGGADDSWADDINVWGQVVGSSNGRAFLWESGTMFDLNDRTSAPWELKSAQAVNDRGEIVGSGLLNTDTRAFLAQPPLLCADLCLRHGPLVAEWGRLSPATGETYDVVVGDLNALRDTGDFAASVTDCLFDDFLTYAAFVEDPLPGEAFWILVRQNSGGVPGTYDLPGEPSPTSRDAGISAAASGCP